MYRQLSIRTLEVNATPLERIVILSALLKVKHAAQPLAVGKLYREGPRGIAFGHRDQIGP